MKREEKRMTTDSHSRGSERSHSRRKIKKDDAKANGKRSRQEEINKEITKLKEQLDALRSVVARIDTTTLRPRAVTLIPDPSV